MKKLFAIFMALCFLGATSGLVLAQGASATAPGVKTAEKEMKTHKKRRHHKKKHPVNKGAEESKEKGMNGPENGGTPSGGKAGGTVSEKK